LKTELFYLMETNLIQVVHVLIKKLVLI